MLDRFNWLASVSHKCPHEAIPFTSHDRIVKKMVASISHGL